MNLSPVQLDFLEHNHSAAMTTLRADGTPHVARVGAALVDGKVWSSGTATRVRTRHLRRDPRATLFVFDSAWRWVTLESTVTLLEGPDAWTGSVALFQAMQKDMSPAPAPSTLVWNGKPVTSAEFPRIMQEEQRLIYEFTPVRAYGLLQMPG